MLECVDTRIPCVKVLIPRRFTDQRGFLCETYNSKRLADLGINLEFVQDNDSFSAERGTVRGLHFQVPPFAQNKLVRVTHGAILDVAVDLRTSSPTFGEHVAVKITAEQRNQIFVPVGFAHGFCTLEPNTHVIYKVTNYYAPDHDRGLLWNDPALGIDWPVTPADALLSDRDREHPPLGKLPAVFS